MQRNTPKEVFLHLLSIATLYVSAVNFLQIVFQAINKWIPDALSKTIYGPAYYSGLVRFAISSIIIVFPVYLFTMWLLQKGYRQNSESREFKLRKWLVYFTLFVAALIFIGDLISILHTFLGGEITIRFILKALSVMFVAGIIFSYYLWDIRYAEYNTTKQNILKWMVTAIDLLVLAVVIIGFLVIGSPRKERILRFDAQRVNDLQQIQFGVMNYWQAKQQLPSKTVDLIDPLRGFDVPVDPETGNQYEYETRGEIKFVLCANFALPSVEDSNYNVEYQSVEMKGVNGSNSWNHDAGRVCFERTIDKAFFPPLK